jgi:hypothetical protein
LYPAVNSIKIKRIFLPGLFPPGYNWNPLLLLFLLFAGFFVQGFDKNIGDTGELFIHPSFEAAKGAEAAAVDILFALNAGKHQPAAQDITGFPRLVQLYLQTTGMADTAFYHFSPPAVVHAC